MTLCIQNNFRKMLPFARVNLRSFFCERELCVFISLEAGFVSVFRGGEKRDGSSLLVYFFAWTHIFFNLLSGF